MHSVSIGTLSVYTVSDRSKNLIRDESTGNALKTGMSTSEQFA